MYAYVYVLKKIQFIHGKFEGITIADSTFVAHSTLHVAEYEAIILKSDFQVSMCILKCTWHAVSGLPCHLPLPNNTTNSKFINRQPFSRGNAIKP